VLRVEGEVIGMAKAVICPICGGKGKIPTDSGWLSTSVPEPKICHGCGGRGWVEVSER
jgi:DnaJ-class molecular chaperone